MITDWFSNRARLSEICHLNTHAYIRSCLKTFDEKWQVGISDIFQIQDHLDYEISNQVIYVLRFCSRMHLDLLFMKYLLNFHVIT